MQLFLDFKVLPVTSFLLNAALLDAERVSPQTEKPLLKIYFFIPGFAIFGG